MQLTEYADQEMMMIDLANVLAGALGEALIAQEFVSFANKPCSSGQFHSFL